MKSSSPAFFRQPIWFSHRGHPAADGVENTREAFDRAKNGVKGLETDLRISSDGHIVLCHNRNLSRLGGPGTDIWTMSRKELEGIRLGGQSQLLFFDEFVEAYESSQWILDIKPETADRVIPKLKTGLAISPNPECTTKLPSSFGEGTRGDDASSYSPRQLLRPGGGMQKSRSCGSKWTKLSRKHHLRKMLRHTPKISRDEPLSKKVYRFFSPSKVPRDNLFTHNSGRGVRAAKGQGVT